MLKPAPHQDLGVLGVYGELRTLIAVEVAPGKNIAEVRASELWQDGIAAMEKEIEGSTHQWNGDVAIVASVHPDGLGNIEVRWYNGTWAELLWRRHCAGLETNQPRRQEWSRGISSVTWVECDDGFVCSQRSVHVPDAGVWGPTVLEGIDKEELCGYVDIERIVQRGCREELGVDVYDTKLHCWQHLDINGESFRVWSTTHYQGSFADLERKRVGAVDAWEVERLALLDDMPFDAIRRPGLLFP